MFKQLNRRKTNGEEGFSLVEVMVASIIFLIAAAGLFAAFSKSRENTEEVDQRLQAAYIGRQILDEMRAKVDSRNWAAVGTDLEPGSHTKTVGNYTISYVVTEDPSLGGLRKVVMNVTW